jgi:hypothetical protein
MAESYKPTEGMIAEAKRGLEWRREFGRGGTSVGIARARDISNGKSLPLATVKRMKSFFARHEVDKKAEGFTPGEKGYPSNGRIAWAMWGGDSGKSWSEKIVKQSERNMDLTSMTERHVIDVEETDDEFIVAFAKAEEVAEEPEEREAEQVETRDLPVQTQYRMGSVRMMDEEQDRRVMMSISSTNPVEREFGYEVLEHNAGSVDMEFMSSGKAPLLLDHDARQQIGVVEKAYMDKDKLRAQVRFSKNAMAEEVYRDVVDGIRGNVSIGYQIQGMTKDENGYKDKPLYRVSSFKPLEVSMVSIPADSTVGGSFR